MSRFFGLLALLCSLLALSQLPSAQAQVSPATANASLCLIFYSLPGDLDYPWSVSINAQITYNTSLGTYRYGQAYTLISGTGVRTYTNRFGAQLVTPFYLAKTGSDYSDNLLYVGTSFPLDGSGISLNFSTPLQFPGGGPLSLSQVVNYWNSSGNIFEQNSYRIDNLGTAWLSSVPGFLNATIGAANLNALAPNYATCQAPITFTNGLRTPTQPNANNGALRFNYSYTLGDGHLYTVQTNLTITCSSAFASVQDVLGNPYQQIVNITGTRTYVYLPTGDVLVSAVTNLSTAIYANVDQRFYPYSLIASSPGTYTIDTAPFFDYNGLEFGIVPSAPKLGAPLNATAKYSAVSLFYRTPLATAVLVESEVLNTAATPNILYQHQTYTLLSS